MIVVDPAGVSPMKYDALQVFSEIVGKSSVRIEVAEALLHKTWHKFDAAVDVSDLGAKWKNDVTEGARQLLKETWVKGNDAHMDAKVYPHMHPYSGGVRLNLDIASRVASPHPDALFRCTRPFRYGTGSLLSEPGSGGIPKLCRNRLALSRSRYGAAFA